MATQLTRRQRNKLSTPGYFIKRLRDNKIITLRVFQKYNINDARKWTILADPGNASVFITCYENLNEKGEVLFHLDDGGKRFNRNYFINTHSIEVVVRELLDKGVTQTDSTSEFYKSKQAVTIES